MIHTVLSMFSDNLPFKIYFSAHTDLVVYEMETIESKKEFLRN